MHPFKHLRTITHHHNLVMKHCFRSGLYLQGIFHDFSKLSPVEFIPGAKYYQGNKSPNNEQRLKEGVSTAWLHHKGRNKHHLEYWIDYNINSKPGDCPMAGMEMPVKYVVEMVCDRMAASKTYRGKLYEDKDPYEYFAHSREHYMIHPNTLALLEKCLVILRDEGEDRLFSYMKHDLLGK